MKTLDQKQRRSKRLILWIAFSTVVNVALWLLVQSVVDQHTDHLSAQGRPVELVFLDPPTPVEPEEPEPEVRGQIVDLPDPKSEDEPEDADYLAEADRTVEEETKTQEFQVNPEEVTCQLQQL